MSCQTQPPQNVHAAFLWFAARHGLDRRQTARASRRTVGPLGRSKRPIRPSGREPNQATSDTSQTRQSQSRSIRSGPLGTICGTLPPPFLRTKTECEHAASFKQESQGVVATKPQTSRNKVQMPLSHGHSKTLVTEDIQKKRGRSNLHCRSHKTVSCVRPRLSVSSRDHRRSKSRRCHLFLHERR